MPGLKNPSSGRPSLNDVVRAMFENICPKVDGVPLWRLNEVELEVDEPFVTVRSAQTGRKLRVPVPEMPAWTYKNGSRDRAVFLLGLFAGLEMGVE